MKSDNHALFDEFEKATFEEWKKAAEELLKGKPYEKAMLTPTYEGITLNPIYMREDAEKLPHVDAYPGFEPFVRGGNGGGYMAKPWDICQELQLGHPREFNKAVLQDLYNGQTALGIRLDRAARLGRDPDEGEELPIGQGGLSLSTLQDMELLMKDIVLEVLPLYINAGANPLPMISLLGAYLKSKETTFGSLKGCVGSDPLGELAAEGKLPISLDRAYDLLAQYTAWAAEQAPELRTILVESHVYHNGGSNGVQELAYALAVGETYIRELLERGLTMDVIAPRIAFSFSLGSNFFMEIAKLRAARMLWAQLVKAFGGNEAAQRMLIHGKTSSWTKTVYDPYVNMLRNASEAFAGAMGGVDSLHVVPFDEPVREADGFSRRISRNVQSILQDECHFTQPIDPAGGSWYIESLTHQLAEKAWSLFQDTCAKGGMQEALMAGLPQQAVAAKYEEKFAAMSKRTHVWVGTNMYANLTEEKLAARTQDSAELKERRIREVQEYRLSMDMFSLQDALIEMNTAQEGLIEKGIEAVLAGATLGDLSDLSKDLPPETERITPVKAQRGAERFEALRQWAADMKKKDEYKLKIFLFNMGPLSQHKARADFTTGFFEVGGFEVLKNNGFDGVETAVAAALQAAAGVSVICSADETYPELVPAIAAQIKAAKPAMKVFVAGRAPKELEAGYREAGVDGFIYLGANCYGILKALQEEIESNE